MIWGLVIQASAEECWNIQLKEKLCKCCKVFHIVDPTLQFTLKTKTPKNGLLSMQFKPF